MARVLLISKAAEHHAKFCRMQAEPVTSDGDGSSPDEGEFGFEVPVMSPQVRGAKRAVIMNITARHSGNLEHRACDVRQARN
jgi:hypothetical protein